MGTLLAATMIFLLLGLFFISTYVSYVLTLFGLAILLISSVIALVFLFVYVKESISTENQPPVAGLMLNQLWNFSRLFDYQTTVARKHKTYRLVMPFMHSEIYTANPLNVEYFLRSNFSNYEKGPYHFGIMKDLFGDGIFAVDGNKWRHQRKLASYEFSTKILRNFSSGVFKENALKLVSTVSTAAAAKQIIDLQDTLMKITLDSIFKVGFGIELNTLSGSDEIGVQFTKAFDDSNVITYWRYVDMLWKIKRILNIGVEATLKQNIKIIDNFVFKLIRCKREQIESGNLDVKEDILSRFLMESTKDPETMTDQYLRDIILNFIIAGKDTTANTLTWFFYMLCKYPLVQEKIAQEVAQVAGVEGILSADEFSKLITEAAMEKMYYLHAALTETLRLYPAVPDGKFATKEDILPDGFKVRKGDGINYIAYAMGRMTYVWGDDAAEFRPERWIDHGVFRPESPFKFTAFHGGPRICLGKDFAYRQMKILAAILTYFFKFKMVDETKEATYRTMFTLHMEGGLPLFAIPRL
ncbi:hypothetical protein ACFE04_025325 [Oxalis oulophora]